MNSRLLMDKISLSVAFFVLLLSFAVFYSDTQEPIGSLTAAILSALLTWVSCIMISWLIRVFIK